MFGMFADFDSGRCTRRPAALERKTSQIFIHFHCAILMHPFARGIGLQASCVGCLGFKISENEYKRLTMM